MTAVEFAQIQALAAFTADSPSADATCQDGEWQSAHGVKFCVLGANTQAVETPAPAADGSDSGSSGIPYLVYWAIGGAILVLLLLLALLWQRRSHRSCRHSSEANTPVGDSHAVFAPSPAVAAAMRPNQAPVQATNDESDAAPAAGTAAPSSGAAAPGPMAAAMAVFTRKSSNNDNNNGEEHYVHDALKGHLLSDPDLASRRIPASDLRLGRCISRGGFGLVFVGDLRGRQVAVKKIRNDRTVETDQIEQFIREITLISTLQHPRIVEFIGVSWENTLADLAAVTELMERGDLRNVTRGFKRRGYRLTWDAHKTRIAMHVAQALEYLHSRTPAVVHRDLKAKNVLLNVEMEAKLSDFGIARERPDEASQMMTAGIGTSFWIAPEVLMGRDYDERADIYSFGVVLSELDTDDYPYWNASNPPQGKAQENEILRQVASGGRRPAFGADCPGPILAIAARCLQAEPSDRPSAAELVILLQQLEREGVEGGVANTTAAAAATGGAGRESTYIITTRNSMPTTDFPANRASYSRYQSSLSRSGSSQNVRSSLPSPPTVHPSGVISTVTTSTSSNAAVAPARHEVTTRTVVTGSNREVVIPPRPAARQTTRTITSSSTQVLPQRAAQTTVTRTTTTTTRGGPGGARTVTTTSSSDQPHVSQQRATVRESLSELGNAAESEGESEEQKSNNQTEYKWILY